ncbi:hypothetical protein DFA_07689 [Cavenderia fasciculata]|uniref:Fe2OG dioxygenase domain-containing protein n=1 Tax=Cavenderia fasciculata TaxID=261658 RepID=F4Q2T5_CACFS|nr:uncharacterized protein DFA_07689 [Cavenderia fasciculata]EGG16711.1 hypothetical protein DFA_07689 [Cavenderia fasciculata]|eukprot:XP_004355185.1 hypothetical protein DFA_07689 [Cavenderia fasciculata]
METSTTSTSSPVEEATVSVPEGRIITGSDFNDFGLFSASDNNNNNNSTTSRQDLNLQTSHGFLVHDMLSAEECDFYVKESESKGYRTIEKEFPKEYRNNLRYIGKNKDLSNILWKRLEQHFKKEEIEGVRPYGFDQDGIWIPLELDDCFTFGRYEPGGRFKPHLDAVYASEQNKRSIYTMQIYLNDEFEGGHTNFYLPANPLELDTHVLTESVKPRKGSAILFNHDTLHEGAEVLSGRKYIMRVDMMFLRIHQGLNLTDQQKADMKLAKEIFFLADSFEKDKGDLETAISTYVKAQMMLAQYPSTELKKSNDDLSTATSSTSAKIIIRGFQPEDDYFTKVPEYLFFSILNMLSITDIGRFRSTSKSYFKTLTKDALWKNVYIKNYSYSAFKFEEPNVHVQEERLEKKKGILGTLAQRFKKMTVAPASEPTKCWYLTVKNIQSFTKGKFIYIDFGSEYIKYSNYSSAYLSDLSRASLHQDYSPHYVMSSMDRETWNIGRSAHGTIQTPVIGGCFDIGRLTTNYQIIRHILTAGFNERYNISSPIHMALSPGQMTQLPFLKQLHGKLFSTSFIVKDAALLVLQVHGLESGTVVMMGHGATSIVCIVNRKHVKVVSFPVTGSTIAHYTTARAQEYGTEAKIFLQSRREPLKERYYELCQVSMDYKADASKGSVSDSLRFSAPEILFDPALNQIKSAGIVESTLSLIKSIPEHASLLNNVVITGGNSCWKHFEERFTRDIQRIDKEINVYASHVSERQYDVLKGLKLDSCLTKSIHDIKLN